MRSRKVLIAIGTILAFVGIGHIGASNAHAAPNVLKIHPQAVSAGAPTFTLKFQGSGFVTGANILFDGAPLASPRVPDRRGRLLYADVDSSLVASPGTHTIQAVDPDGSTSSTSTLTVIAPDPDIFIRLSGDSAEEGTGLDLTLNLTGQGFTTDSVAFIWGNNYPVTFVSSSTLTITIPAALTDFAARIPIAVQNKVGQLSNTEIFFVIEKPPKTSAVNPDIVNVGDTGVGIIVTGNNFHNDAVILVNGQPLATTSVKGTKAQATLPDALLSQPGELIVRIQQDGIQSDDQMIIVAPSQAPFILSAAPNILRPGTRKAPRITLFGANFSDASKVSIDGQRISTNHFNKHNIVIRIGSDISQAIGQHTIQISDASGNTSNVVTFEVVPDVTVSTLAGRPVFAFNPGCVPQGSPAFKGPRRLALAPNGLLYVTDQLSNAILSVDPSSGEVCAVAGTGNPGYSDSGNSAGFPVTFADPNGITAASDGTLYVSENGNAVVRRMVISSSSVNVTTFAGTGLPIDNKDREQKLNSTLLGFQGFLDGPALTALFQQPDGMVIGPDGTIYVADASNAAIRRIRNTSAGWVVDTIAGSGVPGFADGEGANARLNNPAALALSNDGKTLYVADFNDNRIRTVDLTTFQVSTLAGNGLQGSDDGPPGVATFNGPIGLAVDTDGTLYVSDFGSNIIRRVAPDGTVNTLAGHGGRVIDGPGVIAGFIGPLGLAIDRAAGILYICEFNHSTIRKIALR